MFSKANETLRQTLRDYNVTAAEFMAVQDSNPDFEFCNDSGGNTALFHVSFSESHGSYILVDRFGCRGDSFEWDYANPWEMHRLSNAEKAYTEYKINEWLMDIEPGLPWKFWQDHDYYRAV